jgi:DNA-binding transcriptional MocR family regulator
MSVVMEGVAMEAESASVLYESVASDITSLINSGTLGPGDRVPSVRHLSRQRRVSISTVLQAYAVLENRGMIEARPQSGYYVRAPQRAIEEPDTTRPPRAPRLVGVQELVGRVVEACRQPDVVSLGGAIPGPELVPTAKLQRIISAIARRQPQLMATYGMPPGREELRRQIALHARDWGVSLSPDEIVVTNGCMEALNLCLRAVARPGDIIALESPTYFAVLQVIESLGMKALEIPTHPREGVSLEALELALDREKVKACLIMPNVSNPLGSNMSDAAKKRLVQMLAERDVPLIEDGVYNALHFGATPPYVAKAHDRKGMVMLCSSFTKSVASGLRVGWAAPGRYYEQVRILKFMNTGGMPELLQLALAEFLENGGYERHLRSVRRTYARLTELGQSAVARHFPGGTRVTRPSGGFVLWVELPKACDAVELYELAMKERIGFAPGPMFSATNRYHNCLRLSCAVPWTARIEGAYARLGELAHRQLERSARRA